MLSTLRLTVLVLTLALTFGVAVSRARGEDVLMRTLGRVGPAQTHVRRLRAVRRRRLPRVVSLSLWHLAATHHRPRPRPRLERLATPLGVRVARYARRFLGVPYVWGGDTPQGGFDCSGLVRFVYSRFGVELPHSSYADFDLGVSVPRRALAPGDLVFFNGLGHVGIYIGGGRFINAPETGSDVSIASLGSPWWASAYDGARRLVGRGGHLLASV